MIAFTSSQVFPEYVLSAEKTYFLSGAFFPGIEKTGLATFPENIVFWFSHGSLFESSAFQDKSMLFNRTRSAAFSSFDNITPFLVVCPSGDYSRISYFLFTIVPGDKTKLLDPAFSSFEEKGDLIDDFKFDVWQNTSLRMIKRNR